MRAKIKGTKERPRFSVFRSNKHIFLQLIDDEKRKTILSVSDRALKKPRRSPKANIAYEAGKLLAKKALDAGIKNVVFDRGGYKYHGRVAKVADGAREAGLKF